jgi:YfiH family protein
VRTADCVPLLLADRATGFVAAVHAGWKGVAACIAERAIEALVREGARPSGIVAAIGPHIRACCFEVGGEVIATLDAASGVSTARPGLRGKPHAELAAALRAQLERAGVQGVDDVGGCTMCDAERFFSYRRDGALAGRLIAAIAPR